MRGRGERETIDSMRYKREERERERERSIQEDSMAYYMTSIPLLRNRDRILTK